MSQMKAVRAVKQGNGATLEVRHEPLPTPGRREVLIRVHAASLNYRDLASVKGEYPAPTKDDVVPVSDGAGEVVAVGNDVTLVKKGGRVSVNCAAA